MARVSLSKVVVRNFGPFVGEHELPLPPNGLISITGKNLDTGGESGSGKSYTLHAIAYALDYCPLSAKDLQSWLTEDPMEVELHLETAEGPAIIKRGRRLSLRIGDRAVEGAASVVEAEIDRLTGVNAKLRRALTYRGQKKPGLFLSMTDTQKKEFFVEVLDLQWAERAIKQSEESAKHLETEKERAEAVRATKNTQYEYTKSQEVKPGKIRTAMLTFALSTAYEAAQHAEREVAALKQQLKAAQVAEQQQAKEVTEAVEPRIAEMKTQIDQIKSSYVEADKTELNRLDGLLKECRAREAAVLSEDRERKVQFDQAGRQLRADLVVLRKKLTERRELENEMSSLLAEIEKLKRKVCPTCSREWSEAEEQRQKKQDRAAEIVQLLCDSKSLEDEFTRRENELTTRVFEPNPRLLKFAEAATRLTQSIAVEEQRLWSAQDVHEAQINAKVAQLRQQIATVRQEAAGAAHAILSDPDRPSVALAEDLETKQTIWSARKEELAEAKDALHRAKVANEENQKAAVRSRQLIEHAQKELEEAEQALAVAQSNLNAEEDFKGLLKGFLNSIFDEILAEISDETNETLSRLPNVSHLTLQFHSDYQTQKGTTRQAIVPVVQFNGEERPLSGCSGGMETSVELAADLAVARVVGRRKDVFLGWISLDESFTGHDAVTKDGCLEVLAQYATDRLVLIIDHGAEMKEAFTSTIKIEHRNGRSSISC